MKKTTLIIVMATLCLNFGYSQDKNTCKETHQPQGYKYGFCNYKSGYKPGVKITNDLFAKGKSIMVRNLPVVQLYAIALTCGKQLCEDQIIIEVGDTKKLKAIKCYQLIVPYNRVDNFFVIMHQNLDLEYPEYLAKMEMRNNIDFLIITEKDEEL